MKKTYEYTNGREEKKIKKQKFQHSLGMRLEVFAPRKFVIRVHI